MTVCLTTFCHSKKIKCLIALFYQSQIISFRRRLNPNVHQEHLSPSLIPIPTLMLRYLAVLWCRSGELSTSAFELETQKLALLKAHECVTVCLPHFDIKPRGVWEKSRIKWKCDITVFRRGGGDSGKDGGNSAAQIYLTKKSETTNGKNNHLLPTSHRQQCKLNAKP